MLTNLLSASNYIWAAGSDRLRRRSLDNGRRRAVSEQAAAGYDEDRRQLTARPPSPPFSRWRTTWPALRVLQDEAEHQRQATQAAQAAEQIFNNRYVGGIDTYLQVVTAQTTALANERNDIDIMRRQMDASVLLIKALGGGWNVANSAEAVTLPAARSRKLVLPHFRWRNTFVINDNPDSIAALWTLSTPPVVNS